MIAKIRIIIAAMVLCLISSACVIPSVNPFFTDDLLIELPEIDGNWQLVVNLGENVSEKNISLWEFNGRNVKSFDEKGSSGNFDVRYFKIGDNIFADIYPDSPDENIGTWWVFHVYPIHTLCKINLDGNKLTIIPMNPKWFRNASNKTEGLAYISPKEEADMEIFISSSDKWVSFLKENMADKDLFDYDNQFLLKRILKEDSQ